LLPFLDVDHSETVLNLIPNACGWRSYSLNLSISVCEGIENNCDGPGRCDRRGLFLAFPEPPALLVTTSHCVVTCWTADF